MKMNRRSGVMFLSVLFLALASAVPVMVAEEKAAAAPPVTTGPLTLCSEMTPTCGDNCKNTPFEPTKCLTTTYGPAAADVVVVPSTAKPAVATSSPNMLACQGGGYALCFFSGPPDVISNGTNKLPCVLNDGGLTANCTCQYYSSGTYYVDINGILNQGAYFEAVSQAQCKPDGSGCSNIVATSSKTANVCNYVNSQPLGNPANSFYPTGAQVVSTFSFAMSPPNGPYNLATKPAACKGKYAGCMTAPCRFADGSSPSSHKDGDPIQCECPVYDGDYQVGAANQSCDIPSSDGKTYVWSASNTVIEPVSDAKK